MTYQEKKAKKERERLIMEECIKDTIEEMKKEKQMRNISEREGK